MGLHVKGFSVIWKSRLLPLPYSNPLGRAVFECFDVPVTVGSIVAGQVTIHESESCHLSPHFMGTWHGTTCGLSTTRQDYNRRRNFISPGVAHSSIQLHTLHSSIPLAAPPSYVLVLHQPHAALRAPLCRRCCRQPCLPCHLVLHSTAHHLRQPLLLLLLCVHTWPNPQGYETARNAVVVRLQTVWQACMSSPSLVGSCWAYITQPEPFKLNLHAPSKPHIRLCRMTLPQPTKQPLHALPCTYTRCQTSTYRYTTHLPMPCSHRSAAPLSYIP